jgi:hypothetical protein
MTGFNTEPKVVGREQDSRETERECVCERDRALLKMRDGVGNKFDRRRKYLWQMWEDNLRRLRWPLMIVFPQLEYFLFKSVDGISSDRQVANIVYLTISTTTKARIQ